MEKLLVLKRMSKRKKDKIVDWCLEFDDEEESGFCWKRKMFFLVCGS